MKRSELTQIQQVLLDIHANDRVFSLNSNPVRWFIIGDDGERDVNVFPQTSRRLLYLGLVKRARYVESMDRIVLTDLGDAEVDYIIRERNT